MASPSVNAAARSKFSGLGASAPARGRTGLPSRSPRILTPMTRRKVVCRATCHPGAIMIARRVLFLGHNKEDYLSDSLFHGLRAVLGDRVLDYPKREMAYDTLPSHVRPRLYGRGFTLYGLLDDLPLDRMQVPERLAKGEFDLVVVADIWRDFGLYVENLPTLRRLTARGRTRVAIVDGTDSPALYPYGPRFWRVPAWWALPRAHTRFPYFKREWRGWTHLGTARPLRSVHPIAFSIPEEKIVAAPPPKDKDWPLHVVDAEVAARVGGKTGYGFADEETYVADLRRSRFGITTKRAGWDCLRHYEIAANGAVPCFRALHRKPASNAPHGLHAGNCIPYTSWRDLSAKVDALDGPRYRELQRGALEWARANSTRARAVAFLRAVGLEPPG
jgi:hypothetical protein